MDARIWFLVSALLHFGSPDTRANDTPDYRSIAASTCPQDAVDAHVRDQFALYGPRAIDHEYFGFIYMFDGKIDSAVARGGRCGKSDSCSVDTAKAAPLIPLGAKVLGEWHTHPHLSKARLLSADDVRGAQNNRHIRCYGAYYSRPDGEIYAWNPHQTSVPTAMSSAVLIGSYWSDISVDPGSAAIIAAQENPGIQCLSTNTNVRTAATTTKCCRKSTTSRSRNAPPAGRTDCESSCPPPCSG